MSSNVLKVKIAGQRVRYQVSKITFDESDLLKANAWRWDDKKNALYPNDNKLRADASEIPLLI